jgi:hypothetical protein
MCKYMYCNRLISNRISEYRLTWGKILRYSKVVFPWCWRSMEVLPLTCVELLCTVCTCHCKNRRLAKTTMVQNMPSTVTCQGHPAAVLWIDVKRAAVRLAVDMQEILTSIAHSPKMCSGSRMDLIESEHVLKMPTTMICTEPCFAGPFGDLASRLPRHRHHMLSQAKSQYFKGAVIGVWTQQWHSNCLTSPFGVWFLAP